MKQGYEAMEAKAERSPLKGGEHYIPSEPLQCDDGLQRREFKGEWWMCCGQCSLPDWIACCLSCYVPCLAFGWNQMRAFKMSWWKECAKYAIALALIYVGMHGARAILMKPWIEFMSKYPGGMDLSKLPQIDLSNIDPSKLPQVSVDPSTGAVSPPSDPSKLPGFDPTKAGSLPADPTKLPNGVDPSQFAGLAGNPFKIPDPENPAKPLVRDPTDSEMLGAACLYIFASAVAAITALWLAYRRGMLRDRFNIRGTRCGDCTLWCCCSPCALCQETRTLMHNRVEDGVWLGPPRMDEMV